MDQYLPERQQIKDISALLSGKIYKQGKTSYKSGKVPFSTGKCCFLQILLQMQHSVLLLCLKHIYRTNVKYHEFSIKNQLII